MKKAVVTGASGFLGSYLCADLLQNGYSVVAFSHIQEPLLFQKLSVKLNLPIKNIEWRKVDLSDPDEIGLAISGKDVVFHCAAKISFENADIAEMIESNVECTRNVVNACLKAKVASLIFASSVAALGRKSQNNQIDENCDWVEGAFNSPYAISKHLGELEIWRGMEEGLNVSIINPGIILGAGDGTTGSNQIFSHLRSGNKFYPSGINGFVGVKDCATMMRLLYENEIFGQRMIAVSENISYFSILSMAAKEMRVDPPKWELKGLLFQFVYGVAVFCEKVHIPFPLPSAGIKSTSSENFYISIHAGLKNLFSYTPIEKVIADAVSELNSMG